MIPKQLKVILLSIGAVATTIMFVWVGFCLGEYVGKKPVPSETKIRLPAVYSVHGVGKEASGKKKGWILSLGGDLMFAEDPNAKNGVQFVSEVVDESGNLHFGPIEMEDDYYHGYDDYDYDYGYQ